MSDTDEGADGKIFYDPFVILSPLANATGIPLDVLNYTLCQFLAYFVSFWFRVSLEGATRSVRASVSITVGLALCYFCYGNALIHLFVVGYISYAVIHICSPKDVHGLLFFFPMSYLLFVHGYRWMYQKAYCLDVTTSLMVVVAKISLLGTAIHDGMGRDEKLLNSYQKRDAIKSIPSLLEFSSYLFNFQTIFVGPLNHYATWSKFLDCADVPIDKRTGKKYDPTKCALYKLHMAIIFMVLYKAVSSQFPMSIHTDPDVNNRPFIVWWLLHAIACIGLRCSYYFAWTMSDAICNMAGFGFKQIDDNGEADWSNTTNVYPHRVELGKNYKEMVDNWNVWTVAWLRRVVYERFDEKYRTYAVYVTGAVWHGLSAGYYMAAMTSTLFTLSAATFRRCARHYFVQDPTVKLIYDIIGMILCKMAIGYINFPFATMHFWPSLFIFKKMLFIPHIVALLIFLYLPVILPPKRTDSISIKIERAQMRSTESERSTKKDN